MHDLRAAARDAVRDAESAAEPRAERAEAIAAILREAAEKIGKL
jgi:hypothetical protein